MALQSVPKYQLRAVFPSGLDYTKEADTRPTIREVHEFFSSLPPVDDVAVVEHLMAKSMDISAMQLEIRVGRALFTWEGVEHETPPCFLRYETYEYYVFSVSYHKSTVKGNNAR